MWSICAWSADACSFNSLACAGEREYRRGSLHPLACDGRIALLVELYLPLELGAAGAEKNIRSVEITALGSRLPLLVV